MIRPLFFPDKPDQSPRSRSMTASVAVHGAVVAALWSLGGLQPAPPRADASQVRVVSITAPLRLPPLPRTARPKPAPSPPQRFEAVVPPPQAPFPEPKTAAAFPAPAMPLKTETPSVPFATAPQVEPTAPPTPVRTGFGQAVAVKGETTAIKLEAGTFDAIASSPRTAPSAVAAAGSGFGAVALSSAKPTGSVSRQAGFGGVDGGKGSQPTLLAKQTAAGFGAVEKKQETAAVHNEAVSKTADKPVRVLWKPSPKYSEEAIEKRIEGDVVLLVRFLASGEAETLQVVKGLGYGLDEYARQAAESIRFEPATKNDKPVDYVAQVRIRFELAY